MSHRDIAWVAECGNLEYVPLGTFCVALKNFHPAQYDMSDLGIVWFHYHIGSGVMTKINVNRYCSHLFRSAP